ncbi:hypothetical protein GCM10007183_14230 [Staphylococcus muscae]|uniref:Uncharacterized protein n=1 Tax=Staphylococcus muscae TaxID=1294 RepID=A0ABQ1HVI9_9STAP|nr:hypothetical protein GCM10007183_14230 [Staphylococcus muscae]
MLSYAFEFIIQSMCNDTSEFWVNKIGSEKPFFCSVFNGFSGYKLLVFQLFLTKYKL